MTADNGDGTGVRRRFKDQVAVVTGGGYGIGRAIALEFCSEGANVVLASRSAKKLREVADLIDATDCQALAVPTDVADEASVENMVAAALKRFGRIDILVNNSGIAGPTKLAAEISREEWDETIGVNLTGAFLCSKHVSKHMIDRGGGGAIVNVSSLAGRIGFPLRTPYAASKWGMIGLNHSLAAELGRYGIRVNCVSPGAVEGSRIDEVARARAEAAGVPVERVKKQMVAGVPLGRMVTADEVARAVLFFASEFDSSGVTGQAFTVCAGFRMQ